MRTNRTIDEYIAKLESEISVLETVVEYLTKAREVYCSHFFVGLSDHCQRTFLEVDKASMNAEIRNARNKIDWIRREIELAKFRADNRAWRRSFCQRMDAIVMSQSSPSCEELPF